MKIYFACSIRGGRGLQKMYDEVIILLSKYGTVLNEHLASKNLTVAGEALPSDEIYKRDIRWLGETDILVAEVTTPSLGVGYEIAKAENMNKKILCIHHKDGVKKLSAMIDGNPNITKNIEYASIKDLKPVFDNFLKPKE